MTYYVPGSEEKDPAKVIMSLQQAHSKTATNTTDIATNTANIATNTANIATNTTNIATNTTNISALQAGPLVSGAVATQANQETATSTTLAVTPGRQQFHPSASKAWVKFAGSGSNGAQTVNASYNVSGVSRTAAGLYTVSFTTSFSSADYAAVPNGILVGTIIATQLGGSPAAGSIGIIFSNSVTGAQVDPTSGFLIAFGDL